MAASIEIIGTESLGVRGLCCLIKAAKRLIVIDPGLALGYIRHGLLPHPLQVAEGERVRRRIILALAEATDVVLSHFHGDHIPLREANPYQLAMGHLPGNTKKINCWSKSPDSLREKMKQRARDLRALWGPNFHPVEGLTHGPMTFSKAVPHGKAKDTGRGAGDSVMMTRINMGDKVFVHASDIQLLDTSTIELIISWQPNIVLAAGPPLYISMLSDELRKAAWENGLRLARNVDILILDHHLMRDHQGPAWLEALSVEAGEEVYCAADFMGKQRLLLEAGRTESYARMPVPPGWHEDYAKGEINAEKWLQRLSATSL